MATEGWYKRKDGNLFIGSLVAIPAGVDIETLAFRTAGGKAVAEALQDYGAYVADMGDAPFVLFAEPGVSAECDMAGVVEEIQQLQPLLRIVANNAPETPAGGGTPRAPLAPPIDPAFYGPGLPPVDPVFLGLPPRPRDVIVLERESPSATPGAVFSLVVEAWSSAAEARGSKSTDAVGGRAPCIARPPARSVPPQLFPSPWSG